MNSVNLIGRLTRDPRLRKVGDEKGRNVCQLRLAVSNAPIARRSSSTWPRSMARPRRARGTWPRVARWRSPVA